MDRVEPPTFPLRLLGVSFPEPRHHRWQWSAGTGADAAPYFRIQNPWTQSARSDPRGEYIKSWIPELKDVDPKKFQSPSRGWKSPCRRLPPRLCRSQTRARSHPRHFQEA
ncbi:MAG: hypothetical protein IZT59_09455 [Verrucomicrobia bacterium]|nr:hypothetical protein [Verrucomicrobiota bacterium]